MKFPNAIAGLVAFAFIFAGNANGAWPEFRGPRGDGHVAQAADGKPVGLPLHWSETTTLNGKRRFPHKGISTPVVMDGQVWLTTATVDGHDFYAICVDAETGKVRFNEKVFHSDNPEPLGNGASMNSYATPSAVLEPGRVYVHFREFWHGVPRREHRRRRFGNGTIFRADIIAGRRHRRCCSRIC
jgi:hypothetical protein